MKNNWQVEKLGQVCNLQNGYAFKSSDYTESGFFVMRIGNVKNGHICLDGPKYIQTTCGQFENFILNPGDILVSLTGNVGRVGIIKNEHLPAVINQRVARISLNNSKKLLRAYLYYFLNSSYFIGELVRVGHGAAQQNISTKDIENLEIKLPPILEQGRIVKILDGVFEEVGKAKGNAEKNLRNARELFESYLQSVFENKREGWEKNALKNITTKIGSGATPRGGKNSYKTDGISLIRSLNVYDQGFKIKKLAFIDEDQADRLSNVVVETGDVLLNITGASVARCCIIPDDILPARVNQHVSIIRARKEIISPDFLHYLLTSREYKNRLLKTGAKGGSTRQAITKTEIDSFVIDYPKSLSEQKTIVKKLDALSEETKKLEEIYKKEIADLEELKKSVLQKAFRGEL